MSQDEGTSFFEKERDRLSGEITAVGPQLAELFLNINISFAGL